MISKRAKLPMRYTLNALDVQAQRKLERLALKRARNPNRYKVIAKGYRAKYFKKLSSAAAYYHKLKWKDARPTITSLLYGCSVYTSMQRMDLSQQKRIAKAKRLAAPRHQHTLNTLVPPKKIEPLALPAPRPFSDQEWNTMLVGVRVG